MFAHIPLLLRQTLILLVSYTMSPVPSLSLLIGLSIRKVWEEDDLERSDANNAMILAKINHKQFRGSLDTMIKVDEYLH